MGPRLLISLCVGMALSSLAPAAAAQSDADRATARQLAKEGHVAYDEQDYATAADRFARAAGLVPAPTLWLGLARAQAGLGKLVSAQELYRKIGREGVAKGSPAPWSRALKSAAKEVAALEPRVPRVVLDVKGPSAAKVTIDDVEVPAVALGADRPVDPGTHVVRATAEGFAPAERSFQIAEGERASVTLALAALPAATPPAFALTPPVGAPEPAAPRRAPPGPEPAAPASGWRQSVGYAALGVGAAGVALGGVVGVLFLRQRGVLKDDCIPADKCPPAMRDDVDRYHLYGTLSPVGLLAGGALAAGGVALLLTAPRPTSSQGRSLAPALGPGYAGLRGGF